MLKWKGTWLGTKEYVKHKMHLIHVSLKDISLKTNILNYFVDASRFCGTVQYIANLIETIYMTHTIQRSIVSLNQYIKHSADNRTDQHDWR